MSNPVEVVYAPYNFVPLAPVVYEPGWWRDASQDRPFADGISGTVPLRIEARTPLLVGGRRRRAEGQPVEVEFVAAPDGAQTPFIPGSSLRGLIRAVIEIASFGRMRYVDDRRFAFRDLSPGMKKVYGDRMSGEQSLPTDRGGTERAFVPLVSAGWLRFDGSGRWTITPCSFARIEQSEILPPIPGRAPYQAARKYQAYGFPRVSLDRLFEIGPRRAHRHRRNWLGYARATKAQAGSKTARHGTLVFTGQPNDPQRPGSKHMEFVFHDPDPARPLTVPDDVMANFRATHTAGAQREGEGDVDTWTFWTRNQSADSGIPVFYLTDTAGRVESLGLSMMYKLPYRASVRGLLKRHGGRNGGDGPHLSRDGLDLADTLFGHVREGGDDAGGTENPAALRALKGRVSFGHARVVGPARATRQPAAILGAPKPSYHPSYIVQRAGPDGTLTSPQYASYEDDGRDGRPLAELRGWKRYPVRRADRPQQIPPTLTNQTAIQTVLHTLGSGTRFGGEMRLHNVRPAELGALLFALRLSDTFAADALERWHALGLGKPFGFGATVIDPGIAAEDWGDAVLIANDPDRGVPTPRACLSAFATEMDAFCRREGLPPWRASPQIEALLAMADPDLVRSGSLEMMRTGDNVTTVGGGVGQGVPRDQPLEQTVGYGPAHPLASMPLQDFADRKRKLRALPEFAGRARPAPAAAAGKAPRAATAPPPPTRSRAGFRFLRDDSAIVDDELCTVLEDVSEQAYGRNLDIRIRIDGQVERARARSLRPVRG